MGILKPTDLIATQDGSVASRMLVYKSAGTITPFSFDAVEGISEHTAQYSAILSVIENESAITIGGTEFLLVKG